MNLCTERVFHRGDHFFDGLIKECKRARLEILIEAYIFETDELGKRLLRVLRKKAKEGVDVKILIDGIGSYSFCPLLFKKLNSENFEIRVYNPLPFQLASNGRLSLKKLTSSFWRGLININKRNHRKTYIIDKRLAFVGSINITKLHSHRLSGERSWRDSGVRIKDERVSLLRNTFYNSWNSHLFAGPEKPSPQRILAITKSGLRLNDDELSRYLQNENFINRIGQASKRIWITNPYFVPSSNVLEALKAAAKRGVNVTIIIPRKSDMKLFPLINSLSSRRLAEHNVKIFEYRPRILHAKVMIIDDWCTLGSSNLNSRSLNHDLEVDVVLRSNEVKVSVIKQFLYDLADSVELKKHDILKRYGQSVLNNVFFRLLRYWL